MIKRTKAKIEKIKKKFRGYLKEVIKQKASPHEIALGFAVGLFIGILPIPSIDPLICLLAIFLIKRINRLFTFIGASMINPLTLPFVFTTVLWIGTKVTGAKVRTNVNVFSRTELIHMIKPLLIGDLILAFSSAIIGYLVMFIIFKRIEKKRNKKNKKKPL